MIPPRLPAPVTRIAFVVALVGALMIGGQSVSADTSSQTSVTVTIIEEGTLDIAWASQDTSFLVDGQTPALTAASPTVTATATFSLSLKDTRTEGNRTGYTLALSAEPFTAGDSGIDPSLLTIVDVNGLPEGASAATAIGATLDHPVIILTVANGSPAMNTTIVVTIAMAIAPGTMPGNYSGGIFFDLGPVAP
jgi:hypothetical protein